MAFKIPNVEAILAVDNKMGLAKNNQIPWKCKTDMDFFKSKTLNQVVVMGSNTLLSLPKSLPLKDRLNIVITSNFYKYSKKYENYENIVFIEKNHILNLLSYCFKDKIIYIIGGMKIYNFLLPYCSKIWMTKIKSDYECDLIFNYKIENYKKFIFYEDSEIEIIRLE